MFSSATAPVRFPPRASVLPPETARQAGTAEPGSELLCGGVRHLIVLGIDPGTARLGWGVVDSSAGRLRALAAGALRTSPGTPLSSRLLALHDGVAELIARHRPDAVAVEKLYTGRNVTTAIPVGQARGAVLVAAARAGLDVLEFSPHEVKQAVTGYGRADKAQVQAMIRALLGLAEPPRPDDVADALAVAICGAHAQGLRRALAGR